VHPADFEPLKYEIETRPLDIDFVVIAEVAFLEDRVD
jgi:hypothetical protein